MFIQFKDLLFHIFQVWYNIINDEWIITLFFIKIFLSLFFEMDRIFQMECTESEMKKQRIIGYTVS